MTDRSLILDFDGTIAHLFVNYDFTEKKMLMHEEMKRLGVEHGPKDGIFGVFDSIRHQLTDKDEIYKADIIADRIITDAELEAVKKAVDIEDCIDTLQYFHAIGMKIGVSTNNCPECVKEYFETHDPGISVPVAGRVPGRPEELKPSPESIVICAGRMGISLDNAIYVGDNPRDWVAACNAGTRFIGLGTTEKKYFRLKELTSGAPILRTWKELRSCLGV